MDLNKLICNMNSTTGTQKACIISKQKSIRKHRNSPCSHTKTQYPRSSFQEIADVVVALRNKMKRFTNNLLLNVFGLQKYNTESMPMTIHNYQLQCATLR